LYLVELIPSSRACEQRFGAAIDLHFGEQIFGRLIHKNDSLVSLPPDEVNTTTSKTCTVKG
jgi:hypothetical protein